MYYYYYYTREFQGWNYTFGSKERGVKKTLDNKYWCAFDTCPTPFVRTLQVVGCWCLSTLENFSTGRSPAFFDRFSSHYYFVSANTLLSFPQSHWLPGLTTTRSSKEMKSYGIVCVCVCVCAPVFLPSSLCVIPRVHFCQIGTSRLPFYYLAICLDCHFVIRLFC
jgi:hypothetical protein